MRRSVLVLFTLLIAATSSSQIHWQLMDLISTKAPKEQFKLWHYIFKKSYDINSEEGQLRFKNFQKNVDKINEFNQGNNSYIIGLGMFSDVDFDKGLEIKNRVENSYSSTNLENYFDRMADLEDNQEEDSTILNDDENTPDWSYLYEKNYPEIDRKFSHNLPCELHALAKSFAYTINGHLWINNPKADAVSDQFLRNCISSGEENCTFIPASINYVKLIETEGIPLAKDLKWEEKKGECIVPSKSKTKTIQVRFTNCMKYWSEYECSNKKLNSFLASGPYVSLIDMNFYSSHYRSGIFNPETCTSSSLSVIVVQKTKEYIKALLPFGINYGEKGYIRVGNENIPHPEVSCGLKSYGFYPNDVSDD